MCAEKLNAELSMRENIGALINAALGTEPMTERLDADEIATRMEATDVEAWAWLLGLEFTHDSEAEDARALTVKALRAYAKARRWGAAFGADR